MNASGMTYLVPAFIGRPRPVLLDDLTVAARFAAGVERDLLIANAFEAPPQRLRRILEACVGRDLLLTPGQFMAALDAEQHLAEERQRVSLDLARDQLFGLGASLAATLRARAESIPLAGSCYDGVRLAADWIDPS